MSTIAINRGTTVDALASYTAVAVRDHVSDLASTSTLHPAVLKIAAAAYALMVATFWIGFVTQPMLGLALVIVTVCFAAYAGTPWGMSVMARRFNQRHGVVEPAPGSLRRFLIRGFETAEGKVTGIEALVLVTTVPLCLLGAAIAFAVIYNTL
ncbi:MAG: hypothetical protein AB7O56_11765 [Bauldia sp.]